MALANQIMQAHATKSGLPDVGGHSIISSGCPLTNLILNMKHALSFIFIILLISLSSCNQTNQKAIQQVVSKEDTSNNTQPPGPDQREEDRKTGCMDGETHPIGLSIAEKFDIPYEQVITWYCSDYEFEDILLALQTSKMTDAEPEVLLEQLRVKTWEQIWNELDLTK